MTMPKRRSVLLLMETSSGFTRHLIRGIASYANDRSPWLVTLRVVASEAGSQNIVLSGKFDGLIARLQHPALFDQVLSLGLPLVNVSGTNFADNVPWVDVNNASVCRLAADELISRGFTQFGFCGLADFPWSNERQEFFTQEITQAGFACQTTTIKCSHAANDASQLKRLAKWLSQLPQPVGIMAANDVCGSLLLKACLMNGFKVPDQVAVIGVDQDELICELCNPSLSNVLSNSESIGYTAASMLDQLMSGQQVNPTQVKVEPLGIANRRSTDTAAMAKHFLGQAMRFIHRHATDGIKVEDVLEAVPISRTMLETGFRELIGRSPHAEIVRLRLQCAKQLISGSKLSISEIAMKSGYRNVEYFSAAFRREYGVCPSEYRRSLTH